MTCSLEEYEVVCLKVRDGDDSESLVFGAEFERVSHNGTCTIGLKVLAMQQPNQCFPRKIQPVSFLEIAPLAAP